MDYMPKSHACHPAADDISVTHILNGVAPDSRFGGVPIVASSIVIEQRKRGQDIAVVAGSSGFAPPPKCIWDATAYLSRAIRIVPKAGWGTLWAPGLFFKSILRLIRTDLVHLHFGRDLISLTGAVIALILRKPVVAQTHGMLDAPSNALARVIDRAIIARLIPSFSTIMTLTDGEDDTLSSLGATADQLQYMRNGFSLPQNHTIPEGLPQTPTLFAFISRLHPRKKVVDFTRAATRLLDTNPSAEFVIAGHDEGDLTSVLSLINSTPSKDRLRYVGDLSRGQVLDLLTAASVYVLPAPDEPFGMTIIEALATGTPVILHRSAKLAETVTSASAGWTFDTEAELSALMLSLARNPENISVASKQAEILARDFSMLRVMSEMDVIYKNALSRRSHD